MLKLGVNPESLRFHDSTAARHSKSSVGDVSRLVATEHVRNKYSLRESVHLKSVTVLIASIYLQALIQLQILQSIKPSYFVGKGGFIFIK